MCPLEFKKNNNWSIVMVSSRNYSTKNDNHDEESPIFSKTVNTYYNNKMRQRRQENLARNKLRHEKRGRRS